MRINANGLNINYQIDGPEGAPWLLLSNSLATNLSMWDEQVAELKKSFRILRYDQRGHGGTHVTVGRWFPPEFVQSNPKVVDKVRVMIRTTPVKGFIGCAGALADYDLKPGLGRISRPTLLIVGTKDATVPGIKLINQSVPGSR